MSALQEILEKGYVDPELLEQLGEEQKQILFIKMREEQIRKWRVYEAEMERREKDEDQKNGGKRRSQENGEKHGIRRVQWLCGKDGNVWVWVMGEHQDDMSIEQILDKESEEKARRLAETQIMQALRKASNGPIQMLRLSDDLPNVLEREENALKAELAGIELNSAETSSGRSADEVSGYGPEAKPNSHSPYDGLNEVNHFESYPHKSSERDEQPELYDNVGSCSFSADHHIPNNLNTNVKDDPKESTFQMHRQFQHGNDRPKPPPVPEKPAFLRRTVSNTMEMHNKGNNYNGLNQTHSIRTHIPNTEVEKRQSKIFEQLREQRERLEREAEEEARREQTQWEEQERRAREAEESIRRIAQKAREQHRKCLRTSDSLLPLFQRNGRQICGAAQSMREALKTLPRPPKPKSRQSIVQWFRSSELGQWGRRKPPIWFHGIISRLDAERLLDGKPSGAFLVRVTERIFGYTVSYRTEYKMIKNFLIERIPEGYQFMGTNQLVHGSLVELVSHHQTVPITAKGGEVLLEPVGQRTADEHWPDYAELFNGTQDEENGEQ